MIEKFDKFLVIGHRGASSLAPENTLKAFNKAIELKADCIEFDVQESKDSQLVIAHDEDLLRVTGKEGFIRDLTLSELKKLDFGEGEQIPTLEELFNTTKGKILLNLEIKTKGLANSIVQLIHEYDMIDEILISCFIFEELIKIRKIDSNLKIAVLGPYKTGWMRNWISRKNLLSFTSKHLFFAINPSYFIVNEKFVKRAHKNNIKVFPWTVDEVPDITRLLNYYVDGIITNDISKLQEVLKISN